MSELEKTVAKAFKLRGKSRLSRTEFTFALSYELKWFTTGESKEVLDAALKRGLLKEAGEKLVPVFNVKILDVPEDFKPTRDILKGRSLLDRLMDLLATAGVDREMVEEKQKEYGDLITPEVAALIIAREKKLSVEPYIDEAYRLLLDNLS